MAKFVLVVLLVLVSVWSYAVANKNAKKPPGTVRVTTKTTTTTTKHSNPLKKDYYPLLAFPWTYGSSYFWPAQLQGNTNPGGCPYGLTAYGAYCL